jgi:hypothetical protein
MATSFLHNGEKKLRRRRRCSATLRSVGESTASGLQYRFALTSQGHTVDFARTILERTRASIS